MTAADQQIDTFLRHVAKSRHLGQSFDEAVGDATLKGQGNLDRDLLSSCIQEAHRILANKTVCYCPKCRLRNVLFTSRQEFGTSAWYCLQCDETFYRY